MFAPEIIRIPILPLGMVNAFVIKSSTGCIVVDAGIPGSERKIGRVLARHGLTFADIRLIIVTHAHTDHAGSAARLRQLSGAPILAHKDDADFYSRKKPMTYCPTGRFGALFLRTPLPHRRGGPTYSGPHTRFSRGRAGVAGHGGGRSGGLGHSDRRHCVYWQGDTPAV